MSKIINNEQLLKRFPKIELSYDKVLHNKVYNDDNCNAYMLIPKGMKVYVWFTYLEDKNVCLVLSYDKEKKVLNQVYNYQCIFSSECALGTIMYGTLFDYNGIKHFTCEDIFYYKGINLNENNNNIGTNFNLFKKINIQKTFFEKKLEILKHIFKNKHIISQRETSQDYTKNKKSIIIGIPLICNTLEEAFKIQSNLPYAVYSIQLHDNKKHKHKIGMYLVKNGFPNSITHQIAITPPKISITPPQIAISPPKIAITPQISISPPQIAISPPQIAITPPKIAITPQNAIQKRYNSDTTTTLKVMATIQDDIYNLFSLENDKFIGIAMISTYKCSVMMNKLFRNIRENSNLDLLEESEDEEEFENIKEDKYVDLNKSVLMKCVYSKRFKKWQPQNTF
jgi:hypothetical protein